MRSLTTPIKRIVRFVYEYSGARFVVAKFVGKHPNEPGYKEPPSGVLWALGIYVAGYGLAEQGFNRAREIEFAIKGEPAGLALDYCQLAKTYQRSTLRVPVEPHLFRPSTVFHSLFSDPVNWADPRANYIVEIESLAAQTLLDALTPELRWEWKHVLNGPPWGPAWAQGAFTEQPGLMEPMGAHLGSDAPRSALMGLEELRTSADAIELAEYCLPHLHSERDLRVPHEYQLRYSCTNIVLMRACQNKGK